MAPGTPNHDTGPTGSVTPILSARKHRLDDAYDASENRRKDPKVSRACDSCKAKKIRCSGTAPCQHCNRRSLTCTYASKYSRGRPPTPPPLSTCRDPATASTGRIPDVQHTTQRSISNISADVQVNEQSQVNIAEGASGSSENVGDGAPWRASPELVIEGQYVDPTSGLTSFHLAWRKISMQQRDIKSPRTSEAEINQPLVSAGDRPFYQDAQNSDPFPDPSTARHLLCFYFESCVVTYRIFHRQTVEGWLEAVLNNRRTNSPSTHCLGVAKYSIILTILAIAQFRISKSESSNDEVSALRSTDPLFCAAMHLTDTERGFPRLESAQARLIQVLYLLQTFRVNRAWYVFGNVYQIVSSLGLHRRRSRKQNAPSNGLSNYIKAQCAKRVFWVTYTIDKYLSVVMGRPQLLHDDDINQDFPDSVNDEDIGPDGLVTVDAAEDCHIDSLIFHAKYVLLV